MSIRDLSADYVRVWATDCSPCFVLLVFLTTVVKALLSLSCVFMLI